MSLPNKELTKGFTSENLAKLIGAKDNNFSPLFVTDLNWSTALEFWKTSPVSWVDAFCILLFKGMKSAAVAAKSTKPAATAEA